MVENKTVSAISKPKMIRNDISDKDVLTLVIEVSGALAGMLPNDRRYYIKKLLWKAGLLGFSGGMNIVCKSADEVAKWDNIAAKIAAQKNA